MGKKGLAPGTIVAGRYRVVREIGRGGMGAVYVVEHVNTGGQWALKVMLAGHQLDDDSALRFKREARASARVASEHVVKVTDADTAPELGDAPFLVMELLEGEDLERRLSRQGPLPPSEVIALMTQVARGLDRAHAAGVIHRDLKPDNVFLHRREDGSVTAKLLDFGISKLLEDKSVAMTKTSDIFGTPLYMSPEQAGGKHEDIGPATDVWALGLVVFRILTGQLYWTADTVPTLIVQILSGPRDLPSSRHASLGPAFDRWFMKSIAMAPADRFQSAGAQVAELAAALAEPVLRPGAEGTVLLASSPTVTTGSHSSAPPPPIVPPPARSSTRALSSAPRLPGASTESPLVSSAVVSSRGRSLAFLGAIAIGLAIGGLVILLVLAAEPDPKKNASLPALASSSPTLAMSAAAAPDAAASAQPVTEASAAPSASPTPVAIAPGKAKVRPPVTKPKPSSQTDHFDTQK